jgi:hypothetical protein
MGKIFKFYKVLELQNHLPPDGKKVNLDSLSVGHNDLNRSQKVIKEYE